MSQYQIGSVTVTNGDATVVGSGTLWAAEAFLAGDTFKVRGENVFYTLVGPATDDTHLELSAVYSGSTQADIPYEITRDFTSFFDWYELFTNDRDWDQHYTANWRSLDSILGALTPKLNSSSIVVTTDATQTTLMTVPLTTQSTIYLLTAYIVGRCTGGSGGHTGEGVAYTISGTFKNIAGTVTLIGSVTAVHTSEDTNLTGCSVTMLTNEDDALVKVTGVADANISWQCSILLQKV